MNKTSQPLTRLVATFCHELQFKKIPPEVLQAAKHHTLVELDASDFPKDWGVRDGAPFITARKGVGSSSVWLSIAAYPIAEELDIWEVRPEPSGLPPWIKIMMKFYSIFASKEPDLIVNLLGSGRTTVNGSHAIWTKHQIESQDFLTLARISLTYSFVHDRKLFQISGEWDKEPEGDKYKQDIEEVIRSFRFIR